MKKVKIISLLLSLFFLCGCTKGNGNLDNAMIYTTIYPVSYITSYLYGDNSTVSSIYPVDVDINNYQLTEKQIDDYAKGDLFVYIGLGNEKEMAKSFINKNDDILIIDAAYGLNYTYDIKELWLAPNNFLMLAKNIKNSLNEYLNNSLKEENVLKKYDELYNKVSWVDAELRNVAREAKENNNNTLVVASNVFKFLENYGFDIVSLEDIAASGSENALNDIKNKFKNAKYTTIIKLKSEANSELVETLINSKAKVIEFNDLITNTDPANDYVSMQYENIAVLRDLLL